MARLADTDIDVFPLCLGGNVFGWTLDEARSFAVQETLAAFAELMASATLELTDDELARLSAAGEA
ncbi:MAG TPA: hypothetical protein VMS02_08125 [Solirubrobacteraceae bacterium]|nr:hypothetical protein [Solirubrobacteraceae bacterium]